MPHRSSGNMNGEGHLANASPSKREVHDPNYDQATWQIDDIIAARHDRPYNSLAGAHADGS